MNYNLSTPTITYSTTQEYRKVIRHLFYMDCSSIMQSLEEIYVMEKMDEETLDELLYDDNKMDNTLGMLFEKTNVVSAFQTLYTSAASLMLSQETGIGQCVLCSYDYLALYHRCLYDYFVVGHFDEQCESFISLYDKIKK
jgi:hypothetical protein